MTESWSPFKLGRAPLHPRLEAVLLRVQHAERVATGEQRRPTFRLMRELLGASLRLGVSSQLLADCLGISPQSVRSRAARLDGVVTAQLIRDLTDLSTEQLDALSAGELARTRAPGTATDRYATTDVVRALLSTPRGAG